MGFHIVNSLTEAQIDDLIGLYQHTYWAKERQRRDVVKMLCNSDHVFGAVEDGTDRLCAFTRVLTDEVYRAVLFDVVVHPEHRGKGLAGMVLEAVISHPDLASVENLLLYCKPDVIELYEKWGFTDGSSSMHLMKRERPSKE